MTSVYVGDPSETCGSCPVSSLLTRIPVAPQMNSLFSAIQPVLAARLPSQRPQQVAFRHHQHVSAPMRAFSTYSGSPTPQPKPSSSPSEALQALLQSDLAASMKVMAEGAAAQSVEQVRKLSAAAAAAALAAGARVTEEAKERDAPATPPLGMPMRMRSALEQASHQTNEAQYVPRS